jgi:general secretion pathway protein D
MGTLPVPALQAHLPYYRLREITTEVTVEDGSTVAMGGLIYDKTETFKDKVPVLGSIPLIGRLFRSEGEKSVKRNLMIFVTATQVDVNGRKASDMALNK